MVTIKGDLPRISLRRRLLITVESIIATGVIGMGCAISILVKVSYVPYAIGLEKFRPLDIRLLHMVVKVLTS